MAIVILMTKMVILMTESMLSKRVEGQDILKGIFERYSCKKLPVSYCAHNVAHCHLDLGNICRNERYMNLKLNLV